MRSRSSSEEVIYVWQVCPGMATLPMVVELGGGICHILDLCTLLLESKCCYANLYLQQRYRRWKIGRKCYRKRGGAVLRSILRRCCKAVASRFEICERVNLGTVLAGGLENHIFIRRIWATMQYSMDFGARYSRSIFSFPYSTTL